VVQAEPGVGRPREELGRIPDRPADAGEDADLDAARAQIGEERTGLDEVNVCDDERAQHPA
jgi:hypothetical protein